MLRHALASASLLAIAAPLEVRAETLGTADNAEDITAIGSGVSEIGLGALAIITHHAEGDASTTRVNMLVAVGYQYTPWTNLSVGGQLLVSRERATDASKSLAVGGAGFGTYHVRLGYGAFLRPTLALGVLFGERADDTGTSGLAMQGSQTAFLTRLLLPFAYYTSRRFVFQAGPELDISMGSVEQARGGSSSYTTVASGFSVGLGYAF